MIENKRSVFRVALPLVMCGTISIHKLYGKKINSGLSNICITDISAGGVQFKSRLMLPIQDAEYKICFKIFGINYDFKCILRWIRDNNNGMHSYGAMFNHSEEDIEELIKVMTKLSLRVRILNDEIYSGCNKKCETA